jgi:hypothetical protein
MATPTASLGKPSRRQLAEEKARRAIGRRSPLVSAAFGHIFERSLAGGFNATRVAKETPIPAPDTPRLVLYTNHPAWWDAVLYVFLARRVFANRPVFSPMEASMLERYGFMGRMGAFGVARGSIQAALDFRAASTVIFERPDNFMIIACQGRFADVRERPLRVEGGIAHLPDVAAGITFAPLAIEYVPWQEKRPECLLRFGETISGDALAEMTPARRLAHLETALETTMSSLARLAIARDPEAFETLLTGQRGVNPIYDTWRRLRAWIAGRAFHPEHGSAP